MLDPVDQTISNLWPTDKNREAPTLLDLIIMLSVAHISETT